MRWTLFAWLCVAIGCGDSGSSQPDLQDTGGGPSDGGGDAIVKVDGADGPIDEAACSDGIDNDSDGLTDYPADPGCADALDDDESNGDTECSDGIDNDGDGLIDFGSDPGCSSLSDDDELDFDPKGCGGLGVYEIGVGAAISGTLAAGSSNFESNCGGFGAEVIYHITIDDPGTYVFSTVDEATTLDSVVYARSDCDDETTEVGCNDQGSDPPASTLIVLLEVGEYFIFVDSWSGAGSGDYVLHVFTLIDIGGLCDPETPDQCAPGLLCRTDIDYGTDFVCLPPVCSDETDDDGDGLIDFPLEPGCESPEDADETDGCPDTDCPECADGTDNDKDGNNDFPEDPGCASAADLEERDECIPGVFAEELTTSEVSGTISPTSFMGSDFSSCGWGTGDNDEDIYAVQVTQPMESLRIQTIDSPTADVILYVRTDCDDPSSDVACVDGPSNDATLTIDEPDLGTYYIFIDGNSSGSYTAVITGEISAGGACDPTSSIFLCESGYACDAVTETCDAALCNNGVDDDGDGLTDYPNDPGCDSINDDTDTDPIETPECFDDIDDDGDGLTDFPDDPGCNSAADDDELDVCTSDGDLLLELPLDGVDSGTTSASGSDYDGSCELFSDSDEVVYRVPLPGQASTLRVSTCGSTQYATTLYVRRDDCGEGEELGCTPYYIGTPSCGTGWAELTLTDVDPGILYVFVDGYYNDSIAYTMTVTGTLEDDEPCDPSMTWLSCNDGLGCFESLPGANDWTCRIGACDNGVDDDGDGATDYPTDFGCTSGLDNTEGDRACHDAVDNDLDAASDYPNDPGCLDPTDLSEADPTTLPACANGGDDDGDATNDYPGDPGCYAAADPDETDPCLDGDAVPDLTATRSFSGTTSGMTDSYDPSGCATSSTAADAVFLYRVLAPRTVTVNVEPSGWDSIVWVRAADCLGGLEVKCDDGGPGGGGSEVTFTEYESGDYYIFVSGATGSDSGAFDLTITDQVALLRCVNGEDDDADGLIDYPEDPGCISSTDDDESDLCTPGGDTATFLPDDGVAEGSTSTAGSDYAGTCEAFSASNEVVYTVSLPGTVSTMTASLCGSTDFATVIYVRRDDCGTGDELACAPYYFGSSCTTAAEVVLNDVDSGQLFFFVDGYYNSGVTYQLTVTGMLEDDEPCDPEMTWLGCSDGHGCLESSDGAGDWACRVAGCSNGLDDDGDSLIDFPDEPGCASGSDDDETDSCPGAGCPECADGLDNDGDGDIDFGADTSCNAASNDDEACASFGTDDFGYQGCEADFSSGDIEAVCPDPIDGDSFDLADDDLASAAIGFTFDYYGTEQTDANIISNGKISFGADSEPFFTDECLPASSGFVSSIFTFWDDLYPPDGTITYDTVDIGGSQAFVVRWNVSHFSSTGELIDVRAVLHENGDIDVCYVDTDFGDSAYDSGGSAAVGIEGPTTADYLAYSCNEPVLYEGLVLHYRHP